jgi:UDP-N-acetylglucosamine 1-carboxyvinyltransferase
MLAMERFRVVGGARLEGEVKVTGAKNSVLKVMAAALLAHGRTTLTQVPHILDVEIMGELLRRLGCEVDYDAAAATVAIDVPEVLGHQADYDLVRRIRASICVLGPLTVRCGRAEVAMPGGDAIGNRPLDFHLAGLAKLGAELDNEHGYIVARAPRGLSGATVWLDFPSVGATENILMAAVLATGTTVIDNAAREPEIDDLIAMLCAMGARIDRTAERRIEIEGVEALHGADHQVIGDRLEAETFAIAAAITRGTVLLRGINPEHLGAFLEVADRIGLAYETDAGAATLRILPAAGPLRAVDVRTDPYPGFATDFQAPLSVLLTQADGVSTIHETIFEDRMDHARQLVKMGAEIELLDERRARITGPTPLHGAEVVIADLRAGATLILAALVASGTSVISGIEHVDRGYEQIEAKLVALGAQINRIEA